MKRRDLGSQDRLLVRKKGEKLGRLMNLQRFAAERLAALGAEAIDEAVLRDDGPQPMCTIRRARIPEERAVEFSERVAQLAEEFTALPREGDTVFGFVAAVYPTNHPVLPADDAASGGDVERGS